MKLGKGISVKMLRIKSEVALLMIHDIKKQKKCFLKVNNIKRLCKQNSLNNQTTKSA